MFQLSQAVVLVSLFSFIQPVIFVGDEEGVTLSCLSHRLCRTAFASHNPITLKCENKPEHASIYWQYLDVYEPDAQPVTFIQSNGSVVDLKLKPFDIMLKSKLILGDLKIKLPSVEDTGIYTCKAGEKILAYYEIDFQDAKQIHISHASLGQKEQANTTIDLGEKGTVEMFTVWTDWQPCDRCGVQGERKKVGFCYAKITPEEEPVPCGLLNTTFKQVPLTHGPELRIEMCNVSCDELLSVKEDPNNAHFLLLDNYHTHLHADALLKCPTSSIYRPVYWEHANNSVTHLQQLLKIISYSLDNATGGGSLFIPVLNKSDAGIYKCYVNHKLAGKFQVTFPNINYKPERVYTLAESLVIGLSMFLISLMLLSIAQACRKTVAVGAR